jgi:pyruvate kinase
MASKTGDGATKIVATIADNAEKPGALDALLAAGVDVVRLNGAHAKPGDIARRTALVRRVAARRGRPVGVLLDLGGPKIRIGALPGGSVSLATGRTVEIAPGRESAGARAGVVRLAVTYPALLEDVKRGAEIRIDDGRVRLEVTRRVRGALHAVVRAGGRVKSEAGVNFPDSTLTAPALTAKDRRDLDEALAAGVDFVGLSFVRSAAHVAQLRRLLERVPEERRPWIVAKIERPEALRDLDRIAAASDALMVARGDLGVEIGLARVPAAQREILAAGRRHAVPVIVATQMLESMIECPVPTRAEVSDVALAVHDGADAVMLSGETAIGSYPVEAVTTMGEIACAAEAPDADAAPAALPAPSPDDFTAVMARAAVEAARLGRASALVVHTESGRTARLASKSALALPIVAFTPREAVRRKLTLLRDVVSFRVPKTRTVEERIRAADALLAGVTRLAGATIVEVSGASPTAGATNVVRLRRLP